MDMVNYLEEGPMSVSTIKTSKKGMGTMGFLDMDVETSGLTLRIKLCKNMHKWVHENQGYSYIDQGHVKCIQFCLRLCRGPTFSKPKGA